MPEPLRITDGTRPLGQLIVKGDKLEAFTAEGEYIASFKATERKAAMAAVCEADRAARAKAVAE